MLPTVCFEAGPVHPNSIFVAVPSDCCRKWMSGQADALTASQDRGHFANQSSFPTALRESLSAERPPSLLDFYLSWMSPSFLKVVSFPRLGGLHHRYDLAA
jgi:hypothetical protein